jgi:hypothetical protein
MTSIETISQILLENSHRVPLRNRKGETVAYSIVSDADYDIVQQGKWHLDRDGYAVGTCGDFIGKLHRFIIGAKKGDPMVDHINNDRLDNRKENLRFATPSENGRNKSKAKGSTSDYYGVSFDNEKKKWTCRFNGNKNKAELFRFEKEEHAAYWYDVLMTKEFGTSYKINNVAKPDDFVEPVKKVAKNTRAINQVPSGRYKAEIGFNGKQIYIGTYDTEEEAADAYDKKKAELQLQQSQSNVIKRNKDGYAILEVCTGGTIIECIIDDDIYCELIKFTWCFANGYVARKEGNTTVLIHRHIMNAKSGTIIDHINNNPLDNRKVNLRISNDSLNMHNKKKSKNASSIYHGVSKTYVLQDGTQCYVANISKDRTSFYLGTYRTEVDAARAYNKKAIELYKEYARLNVIN